MIGIYKITNTTNGKMYIGQSTCIQKRWNNHKSDAFNKNAETHNHILYKAIRKYGVDSFLFEVVEECSKFELNDKEQFYIKHFQTLAPHGYNITPGGSRAVKPQKLSIDSVYKIIEKLQTTLDPCSVIAKEFNVSSTMIEAINKGTSWTQENITYPIRPPLFIMSKKARQAATNWNDAIEYDKQKTRCAICGKIISVNANLCHDCQALQQQRAERPNKIELAKMVCEQGFTRTGKQFNVSGNTISKWCKAYNIPHTRDALKKWYYEEMNCGKENLIVGQCRENTPKQVKKIHPKTKEIISIYPSIGFAARAMGKSKNDGHIGKACQTGGLCYGFYWSLV